MKKLLVSLLAIAGLVACTNDEVVNVQKGNPITFDSFVENATRANDPSTTTNSLNAFRAWAFMDEVSGEVLKNELVEKVGSVWSYANVQYWMPGHTYYFAALAPEGGNWALNTEAANTYGAGIVNFINVNGSEDLLYAATAVESKESGNLPVKFQFSHLLSKINFTFVNGFATSNVDVEVKNVTMTAPASASINLAVANWWDNNDWVNLADGLTLEFGDVVRLDAGQSATATDERLTIPASAEREYEVNFDVVVYSGEVATEFTNKSATIKGVAFEMGKAYNLTATISPESLDLEAIEFEVAVNEWDKQDVNCGEIEDEVIFVNNVDQLKAALAAATGDTNVIFGDDITAAEYVTIPEIAGATISIYGNGFKFDGGFFIDGKTTYAGATTIFDDVEFVTSDNTTLVGDAFIYCGEEKGTNFRYPDNVVVRNCTFTATGAAVEKTVGIKFWSLEGDLNVKGCSAGYLHSLMQLTSCGKANVVVDGVNVANGKNGISMSNGTVGTIKNSEIVAREYGVRVDGTAGEVVIKDTKIAAKQPVIARKVTTAGLVLNVDEASELVADGLYQVIFTAKSDDAEYVAPAVDFTFNGPATTVVFPNNYTAAATTDELNAAIENDNVSVVEVTEDLTYGSSVAVSIDKDLTINAEGNTISAGGASSLTPSVAVMGEYDVTLNDANIVGGFVGAYYGAYVEVNGGSLKFTDGQSGRNCFYAAGTDENTSIIVINDVDVNMANASGNSYLCAHGNAIIYVNGGNFYGKPVGSSHPYVKEAAIGSYTGKVIITGGTFNFDPSAWVADGYVATQNGSTWTVSKQ